MTVQLSLLNLTHNPHMLHAIHSLLCAQSVRMKNKNRYYMVSSSKCECMTVSCTSDVTAYLPLHSKWH